MGNFTLAEIKEHPAFQNISDDSVKYSIEKQITQEAWDERKRQPDYYTGSHEKGQQIQQEFNVNHPMGPELQVEENNRNNGFFKNLGQQFSYGFGDAVDALQLVDDAMPGQQIDDHTAHDIYQDGMDARLRHSPTALKEITTEMNAANKEWAHADTFREQFSVLAKAAGTTIKQAVTNLEGVALLAAGSASNSIPGLIGGAAGSLAGPWGARSGALAGSFLMEQGSYFGQSIRQEMAKQGLDFTEANIQKVLENPETLAKIRAKAALKGAGTSIVDTAISAKMGILSDAPVVNAKKAAVLKLGSEASKEAIETEAKAILKSTSALSKTGRKGKILAAEIASEPLSDATGTLAAGDGIEPGGLMGETLGALGMGPIMAPMNVAIHGSQSMGKAAITDPKKTIKDAKDILLGSAKLGTAATVGSAKLAGKAIAGTAKAAVGTAKFAGRVAKEAFVEKTPEQLASMDVKKKNKAEEVKLKRQAIAPAAHKYKEQVDILAGEGNVDEVANPESESFNPTMAVDAIKKINTQEGVDEGTRILNREKADDVLNHLKGNEKKIVDEWKALTSKEEPTGEDLDRSDSLMRQRIDIRKTIASVSPAVKSLHSDDGNMSESDHQKHVEQIKQALHSDESTTVSNALLTMFGSRADASTDIVGALESSKIDDLTRDKLQKVQTQLQSVKTLETAIEGATKKSVADVHNDVLDGSEDFMGIKTYTQSISKAIQAGEVEVANKYFMQLKAFAGVHRVKAGQFQRTLDVGGIENLANATDKKAMIERDDARKLTNGERYSFGPGFKKTIDLMTKEASALTATVEALKPLFPSTKPITENRAPVEVNDSANLRIAGFRDSEIKAMGAQKANVLSNFAPLSTAERAKAKQTASSDEFATIDKLEIAQTRLREKKTAVQAMGFAEFPVSHMQIAELDEYFKYKDMSTSDIITKGQDPKTKESHKELLRNVLKTRKTLPDAEPKGKIDPVLRKWLGEIDSIDKNTINNMSHEDAVKAINNRLLKKNPSTQFVGDVFMDEGINTNEQGEMNKHYLEQQDSAVSTEKGTERVNNYGDPKEDSGQSSGIMENQTNGIEGAENAKDLGPTFQKALTTPSEKDPTNKVKNTFESKAPKKNKDLLLHASEDMHQILDPQVIKHLKVFTKENPMDANAEKVIHSMRDFSEKSQKAFKQVHSSVTAFKGTAYSTLTKMVSTIEKRYSKYKPALQKAMNKHFGGTTNLWKTREIVDAIDSDTSLNPEIVSILKQKLNKREGRDFRDTDAMQYLADEDGKILPNVVNSIMAVSHEWLATKASDTLWNDDRDIISILGIKGKTEFVRGTARDLLGTAGIAGTALINALGTAAYDLLRISPVSDNKHETKQSADAEMEGRLKQSLGAMAVTMMQQMGYLESSTVFSGHRQDQDGKNATQGLAGLANRESSGKPWEYNNVKEHFRVSEKDIGAKAVQEDGSTTYVGQDEGFVDFYRVTGNEDPKTGFRTINKEIADSIITPFRASPHTWSLMIKGEKSQKLYSFVPPKRPKLPKKLKGTEFRATPDQSEKQSTHEEKPRKVSHNIMALYWLLGDKNLDRVQGMLDPDSVMVEDRLGAQGINRSILKSREAVADFMNDVEIWADGKKEIYIREEFWRHGRMGEVGTINQQGDKNHRALFSFSDWFKDMDLSDENAQTVFMEAIAFNLDIEQIKKGGIAGAISEAKDLLEQPIQQSAIAAIQKLVADGIISEDFSSADMITQRDQYINEIAAITAAGEEINNGISGLRALVEYARYSSAKDQYAKDPTKSTFNTDISTEIDGVGNGMFFERMQLIGKDADLVATLAALENGGAVFHDLKNVGLAKHLSQKFNLDSYMSPGFHWANGLLRLERQLRADLNDAATAKNASEQRLFSNKLANFRALQNLFGEFRDSKGALTKALRDLTKKPTMATTFGMQKTALKRVIGVALVDDIRKKVAKYVKEGSLQKLEQLQKDVGHATMRVDKSGNREGYNIFPDGITNADGTLNKEKVLLTRITNLGEQRLHESASEFYGESLHDAITIVYGSMQKTAAPLNQGVNLAAAMYNTLRKVLMRVATDRAMKEGRKLSVADVKGIKETLHHVYPQMKTAHGGQMALAKEDREKTYNTEDNSTAGVRQKYATGRRAKKMPTYSTGGAKTPGVGPAVLATHNTDSRPALDMMGAFPIINNHDGFTVAAALGMQVAQGANESTHETLKHFDMGKSMYDSANTSYTKGMDYLNNLSQSTGISHKKMMTTLASEMGKMINLREIEENGKPGKSIEITRDNADRLARDTILREMRETAEITVANKKAVVDAMIALEQYSSEGGHHVTGNSAHPITINKGIEGSEQTVKSTQITKLNQKNLKDADRVALILMGEMKVAREKGGEYGSSQNADRISTNPKDYALQETISNHNLLQVYDRIKNDSTVIASDSHDQHLQGILSNLVQNVMSPADLFLANNPNIEPEGKFKDVKGKNGRIFLSSQNEVRGPLPRAMHGIRMSTGEVYTHEFLHSVTRAGLRMNNRLRSQVKSLFNMAKKELDKSGEGFRVFLSDPDIDLTDSAYEHDIVAAKERYDYIFNNTKGERGSSFKDDIDTATGIERVQTYSNYLDEFLVIGLTNENFRKALTGISLQGSTYANAAWKSVIGSNIQETLGNIFQQIMDFFYRNFSSKTVKTNMAKELETLAVLLSKKDSEYKSALYKTSEVVEEKYGNFSDTANKYVKTALSSWPVVRIAHEFRTAVNIAKESDTILGQRMRESVLAYRRLDQGIIKSAVSEIQGRTNRLDWIHRLLSRRKLFLDSAKEEASETYITAANDLFNRKLKDYEKTSMTKVGLMTDASVLFNSFGSKGLMKLLKNPSKIDTQIKALMDSIGKDDILAEWMPYYSNASDAMGYFMVHGRGRSGEVTFLNSRIIAEMKNAKGDGVIVDEDADRAEELVDKLGSLYALKYTADNQKRIFSKLLKEDPDAIRGVFRMHEVLKENSLREAFGENKYQFIKGYIKQIVNTRIGFTYGTKKDEKAFNTAGYVRQPNPLARDFHDPTANEPFYVYTSKTGHVNDLKATTMSFTGNQGKGTDTQRIAQRMGADVIEGDQNNEAIMEKKRYIIARMGNASYKPSRKSGNFMIPQVDSKGNITKYRYMMANTTRENYLEQVTSFDDILGSMAGQVVDKARTPVINRKLIKGLKAMYDREYQKNPGAFVKIGPFAKDIHLRELYYRMPTAARKEVEYTWKSKDMYVSKDTMDLAFGYRQYSIIDAFTKKPSERAKLERMVVGVSKLLFKDQAIHRLNTLESIAIEATKMAKSNIITKSLYITIGNLGSNMVYLKSRGVPVSKIIKLGWEAIAMGNKYQTDKKQLNQLNLKRDVLLKGKHTKAALKSIDSEIVRMGDTLARNPATVGIQAGLLPTLVDDIETITGGHSFPTALEKKVTTVANRLPAPIRNVGKTLVMTEDTKAFKVLNNAVKMTDFIGRYVLYNHYTQDGMEHGEAITSVIDEFVNFDIPTHRMVEYANAVGFLWFTKYGSRILKVIKESAVDKPFTFFMTLMMSNHTGLDNIAGSIPGVTKDLLAPVGNPIGSFLDTSDETLFVNSIKSLL